MTYGNLRKRDNYEIKSTVVQSRFIASRNPVAGGKTKSDNRKMNSERSPRSAQISMRLSRAQLAELDRAAAEMKLSRAEVVHRALKHHRSERSARKSSSLSEQKGDIRP